MVPLCPSDNFRAVTAWQERAGNPPVLAELCCDAQGICSVCDGLICSGRWALCVDSWLGWGQRAADFYDLICGDLGLKGQDGSDPVCNRQHGYWAENMRLSSPKVKLQRWMPVLVLNWKPHRKSRLVLQLWKDLMMKTFPQFSSSFLVFL